jgi:hypothetical protein
MLLVKNFLLIARNNSHLTSFVQHKKIHILVGEWATWACNNSTGA